MKDRDEEIGKASQSRSTVMDAVLAPPDILLLYWTLVKDGVLPRGYESQFAILETAILKGERGERSSGRPVQTTSQLQCGSTREIFRASRSNTQNVSRSISSSWQPWTALQNSVHADRKKFTMDQTPGVMLRRI